MALLLLKAERLLGASVQAVEGGDATTGARLAAAAQAAVNEAIQYAERARAQ